MQSRKKSRPNSPIRPDAEHPEHSLQELLSAGESSGGEPPIDALQAAIKLSGYTRGEPITSEQLAQYWVYANWNLVCFVTFCRLRLHPREVKERGSWRVTGLAPADRERYFAPFLAALGLPPRTELSGALREDELPVFQGILFTLTVFSVQRSIEDYVFRLFNKGLGYGWLKAWELAQQDRSKEGQEALLAILHTSPNSAPSLQEVLDRSFMTVGFDRKFRKVVGKKPSSHAGQISYRHVLPFLCFNSTLVRSFFIGRHTAQELIDILDSHGIATPSDSQAFRKWLGRTFRDLRPK